MRHTSDRSNDIPSHSFQYAADHWMRLSVVPIQKCHANFAPILHINNIVPIRNNRQWTITNELADIKQYNRLHVCDLRVMCVPDIVGIYDIRYLFLCHTRRARFSFYALCVMLYLELWWSLSITNAWLRNELLIEPFAYAHTHTRTYLRTHSLE